MRRPTPERILKLGLGFWAAKTLLSAVELNVFSTLADSPADLATLRVRLGLHPRSARDFLDALVALRLLDRQDGIYSNAPESDLYLDPAKPSYIGGVLEIANSRLYGFWGSLVNALRSGEPQSEGASDFFASIYGDPGRLRSLLAAMSTIREGAAQAVAT